MKARLLAVLAAALMTTNPVRAETVSLHTAWQLASQNDAEWRMAQADAEADREEERKARAGLLPNLSVSSARSRNDTERGAVGGVSSSIGYDSISSALVLRQPLFRMQNYAEYRRAGLRRQMADVRLGLDAQNLATRVAQAYFDLLSAEDGIRYARFQEASLQVHLEGAQRAFKAGVGTRIDIDEARARLAVATYERLAAENGRDNARANLAVLVGGPVHQVLPVDETRVAQLQLDAGSFGDWRETALRDNPELAAAARAVEEADWIVRRARSGHLPTVDLIASRTRSESDSVATISTRSDSSAVGVQMNLPLFAGGYADADTAQARARLRRAQAQKEGVERNLEARLLKEYNGVVQGGERLASLAQALATSTLALESTRRGIEAGTRSMLDALNAEKQLYSVRLEAARARNDRLMSWLRLHALAGKLDEQELVRIDGLLVAADTDTTTPTTQGTAR